MSELGAPERPQPTAPSPTTTPNRGVGLLLRNWSACPEALWNASARPPRRIDPKTGESYQPRLHLLTLATVSTMLTTAYDCDQHFVSYLIVDPKGRLLQRYPRLKKEHLGLIREHGYEVLHGCRSADIDTLRGHGGVTSDEVARIRAALQGYPAIVYMTRAGARVVQLLKQPLMPEQYEASLARWLVELRALLPGFKVDDACRDWTRLMRCPRVMRDGVSYHSTDIEGAFEFVDPGDVSPIQVRPKVRAYDVLATDTAYGLDRAKRFALRLVDAKAGSGYVLLRRYATILGRDAASGAITPETALAVLENSILDWGVDAAVYERAIEDCFEFGLSCGPWPDADLTVDQPARVARLLDVLKKGGGDER